MKVKSLLLPVGFLLVLVASNWSLLHPGLFYIHDYVHAARIAEMSRILLDGQIPPRWSQNFGFGYGMPLFQFYAPLPYVFGAFLYWLQLPTEVVIKLMFFLASAVTAAGSFKLGKRLWGDYGGLFAAAAVTLAPYRALNLYVRGALSEAVGMMTFSWILLSIYLIIVKRDNRWWVGLALSLITLILSHNLSALLFTPVALGFALFLLLIQGNFSLRDNRLWALAKGFGAGFLIPAFYVLPSLLEKQYTKVDQYILGAYFDFRVHFVGLRQFFTENWGYGGSAYGPNDSISFFLGYGQLAAITVGGILFAALLLKKIINIKLSIFHDNERRFKLLLGTFFALVLAVSLFMTHGKSTVVWNLFEPLKYIQFPWRLLSISTLFLALFSGQAISLMKNQTTKGLTYLSLFLLIIILNWQYFKPSDYLINNEEYFYADPDRIRIEMSQVLPDYIPLGLSEELEPATNPLIYSDENVEVVSENSYRTLITSNFPDDRILYFSRADFPGWKVYVDGKEVTKQVHETGLVGTDVPLGNHQVEAVFGRSKIRLISDSISAVALVIFGFLVTLEYRRKKIANG